MIFSFVSSSNSDVVGHVDVLLKLFLELANVRRYSASAGPVCITSEEKYELSFDSNTSARSNSTTLPSLNTWNKRIVQEKQSSLIFTIIRSLSMTVRKRCATVNTVHLLNFSRIAR